jgi:hypothetical protein
VRIETHPEKPKKSSVTFESHREEVMFRLNAPLLSIARWRHLARLGPTSRRPVAIPAHTYPLTITVSDSTVGRVADRLEGEVLDQIPQPEDRGVPSRMLSIMRAEIEPVSETA